MGTALRLRSLVMMPPIPGPRPNQSEIATSIGEERVALIQIAETMKQSVPQLAARIGPWGDDLEVELKEAASHFHCEVALERATRALRHIWLETAASSTSKSYRSPAQNEHAITPRGRFHKFGYERGLQPDALEQRCERFFVPPPEGWGQDHVLFSSAQAAMVAVLTLLASRPGVSPGLRHEGCYFETVDLLALFANRLLRETSLPANVVIAEPVWCDGERFGRAVFTDLAKRALLDGTQSIVVDSTLVGLDDNLNELLAGLSPSINVFRIHSGLKLFQAGLELADIGIVSIYGAELGDELRRIRTLHGAGLRFSDVAALELPLFLDAAATRRYENAIFAHNAALAKTANDNRAFKVSYPLPPQRAPFVMFNLPSVGCYEQFDERIMGLAARRGLTLDKGGSFGFRGHRFETVRPEGKPPFLRVAMGARGGPSINGIIELFSKLTL